jgi:ABC-type bacteriocin/lantibiotic exporter with double-glycine peptidase domain
MDEKKDHPTQKDCAEQHELEALAHVCLRLARNPAHGIPLIELCQAMKLFGIELQEYSVEAIERMPLPARLVYKEIQRRLGPQAFET